MVSIQKASRIMTRSRVPCLFGAGRAIAPRCSSTAARSSLQSPTESDVIAFKEMLDHKPGSVLTNLEDIEPYNTDWTKQYKGTSSIVLRPRSTEEVSKILRYCHETYLGVVPQAGNTGLVGGSIPVTRNDVRPQEIILSVDRMNQILSWDPTTGIVTGEAGGILQEWQEYVQGQGAIIPVDLGSKGSCCIGGNVSTNAGGQYYARYKSLHANVVGLEVVLAGGEVLRLNLHEQEQQANHNNGDNNKTVLCNLKNNTGYDLKHLFIGAEGTLGIITKVALWCSSAYPTSRCAVLCACTSLEQVQKCLPLARRVLGETLAAFEFMDKSVTKLVAANVGSIAGMIPQQEQPAANGKEQLYPYYILIETHGINSEHDEEKMQQFLEAALESGVVLDGVQAQDLAQVHSLWKIRESCNPTVASHGYTYKYDVSLPMAEFGAFAEEMKQHLETAAGMSREDPIITTNWGHIMDGNLHFNVTTIGNFDLDPVVKNALEPHIFECVIRKGGSISAEHGLGQSKHKYLPLVHDPVTLRLMHSIKELLDPRGIMNPGKYLNQGD